MTKNDRAWKRYFDATFALSEIERNGFVYVSATDLKRYGHREPRLMAKQDTLSTRPKIFRDNHLTIFPKKNGEYIIFQDQKNQSYFDVGATLDMVPVEEYRTVVDFQQYDSLPSVQFSESQAIDYAYLASLIKTFTGQEELNLTIRGRLRSGALQFRIPESHHQVLVEGVQIEVDAGYESPDALVLIEAKVGRRDDFHIRQLYYPYLEWFRHTRKPIIPVFLIYTNGMFYLTEFRFEEAFGDLEIVKTACYTINETPVADLDFNALLQQIQPTEEPHNIPYPQANDLDKIIDLVNLVGDGVQTKWDFADYFEFDERQGDYYANAAAYLGLIRKQDHAFVLTENGQKFIQLRNRAERIQAVVELMLLRPPLYHIFRFYSDNQFDLEYFKRDTITEIINKNTNLSGSTPRRRASTIRSWLNWVIHNINNH
ncbi:MAG: hypothetical protein GF372_10045 [Candidatus Marinimicrobia bacterium]|nr:hypothetical protein [Candidatus Neomarinimicrobiota bacterium]